MSYKMFIHSVIICSALFCLSGCFSSSSRSISNTLDPNGVLVLQLGGEPTVFNPILSTDLPSSSVEGYIYNGLLKVNHQLEMVPDLAASYTINESGTVYTFQLKKNVAWHDGYPFTAADVKFTFDKILDPTTNTVRRSGYIINGKPIQISTPDLYTVIITLPQPFAPFLTSLGIGIIPKHLFEDQDINTSVFNREPIGTGPFKFSNWETGQYVKLVKNDDYFGSKPKLFELIFKIIPDANTALVSLEKGDIDEASVLAKNIRQIEKNKHLDLYNYYDLLYTYLGLNLKHPFFKELKVRQAISLAINKQAIVKGVLKGHGQIASIPSSPLSWAYPSAPYQAEYSPDKSRQLLREAGFIPDPKTGMLTRDDQEFEFTIVTNQGNKNREKAAQIIQQFLGNVGIKANIQLMEWNAFIKVLGAPQDPKRFDACILGWSLGLDPDAYSIWHSTQYPKGFNFIGYQNSDIDQLITQGRLETNQEKRKTIYSQIFNQIGQDFPYIFLYFPESISGVNQRVRGLSEPGPVGLFNPIEQVYVVQ